MRAQWGGGGKATGWPCHSPHLAVRVQPPSDVKVRNRVLGIWVHCQRDGLLKESLAELQFCGVRGEGQSLSHQHPVEMGSPVNTRCSGLTGREAGAGGPLGPAGVMPGPRGGPLATHGLLNEAELCATGL